MTIMGRKRSQAECQQSMEGGHRLSYPKFDKQMVRRLSAKPGQRIMEYRKSDMSRELKAIHTHALDFWFARSSVIVIVVLQMLIVNKLTLGPQWLAPALEVALLVPLSFATAWTQGMARDA